METSTEQAALEQPKPKRKYTRRVPLCTDPELKYRYKRKPGPPKGYKPGRKNRKHYEPVRTDAEQRRYSRASAAAKKAAANVDPEVKRHAADHLRQYDHLFKGNPKYSRIGIPDGMNRAMAQEAWAEARARAEEFYLIMVEKGIVAPVSAADYDAVELVLSDGTKQIVRVPKTDEAKADAALKETMVMALGPGHQEIRLRALNTVLKFTKSPPAQKLEVSKAEDLLAAALADIKKEDGDTE
jgi:hypothetical protein